MSKTFYPFFEHTAEQWYQLYDFNKHEVRELSKCKNVSDVCIFIHDFFKTNKYKYGLRRTYALPGLKVTSLLQKALDGFDIMIQSATTIQKTFRGHRTRKTTIPNMMPLLMHPDSQYMKWKVREIFT